MTSQKYRVVKLATRYQVVHDDVAKLIITERQAQACADLLNAMADNPSATKIEIKIGGTSDTMVRKTRTKR